MLPEREMGRGRKDTDFAGSFYRDAGLWEETQRLQVLVQLLDISRFWRFVALWFLRVPASLKLAQPPCEN